MRQRPQPSPAKQVSSQRDNVLQAPHSQNRHPIGRDNVNSWEITTTTAGSDHVALDIEYSDHEVIDLNDDFDAGRRVPQHIQQYQNSGGSVTMTEEKLRRFTERTKLPGQNNGSSPSSSVAPTAWKLDQYRLDDFHNVFRTPHHVPDSQYQAHLLGQTGRRKDASLLTKTCCAQTCAVFSGIAVAFLLFIGILLDTQPLFIPGTLPELVVQSTVNYNAADGSVKSYNRPRIQFLVPGSSDERLPAAVTAYKAALLYFCTMLVSLYVLDPAPFHHAYREVSRRLVSKTASYQDIPDMTNELPIYDLATMGNGENLILSGERRGSGSYQLGLWNRTTNSVKRWLAVRGWYRARKYRKRDE